MECPICFENKDPVHLTCGHHMCATCKCEWFKRSSTCPICRTRIFSSRDEMIMYKMIAAMKEMSNQGQSSFNILQVMMLLTLNIIN